MQPGPRGEDLWATGKNEILVPCKLGGTGYPGKISCSSEKMLKTKFARIALVAIFACKCIFHINKIAGHYAQSQIKNIHKTQSDDLWALMAMGPGFLTPRPPFPQPCNQALKHL